MNDLSLLFDDNDGELKREISLLINKRNAIAHGENEGIGSRKALDLLAHSRSLADWFILNFDPRLFHRAELIAATEATSSRSEFSL